MAPGSKCTCTVPGARPALVDSSAQPFPVDSGPDSFPRISISPAPALSQPLWTQSQGPPQRIPAPGLPPQSWNQACPVDSGARPALVDSSAMPTDLGSGLSSPHGLNSQAHYNGPRHEACPCEHTDARQAPVYSDANPVHPLTQAPGQPT